MKLTTVTEATVESYCGPVAIAAATGKTLSEVVAVIGDQPLAGIAITAALDKLGVSWERDFRLMDDLRGRLDFPKPPTLGQWLKKYATDDANYIVPVTNHCVAINKSQVVDNGYLFDTVPTSTADKAVKSRKRLALETWYKITP